MENEDYVIHFPNPGSSVTPGALVPSIKAKLPKKLKNVKLFLNKDVCKPVPSTKTVSGRRAPANLGSASKNAHLKTLQELCRLETIISTRSSELRLGHLRLAVPAHRNTGTSMPVAASGLPQSQSPKKKHLSVQSVASFPVKQEREQSPK